MEVIFLLKYEIRLIISLIYSIFNIVINYFFRLGKYAGNEFDLVKAVVV